MLYNVDVLTCIRVVNTFVKGYRDFGVHLVFCWRTVSLFLKSTVPNGLHVLGEACKGRR